MKVQLKFTSVSVYRICRELLQVGSQKMKTRLSWRKLAYTRKRIDYKFNKSIPAKNQTYPRLI